MPTRPFRISRYYREIQLADTPSHEVRQVTLYFAEMVNELDRAVVFVSEGTELGAEEPANARLVVYVSMEDFTTILELADSVSSVHGLWEANVDGKLIRFILQNADTPTGDFNRQVHSSIRSQPPFHLESTVPDNVIYSGTFTGQADPAGSFYPVDQYFDVGREAVFGAVRVQITASQPGREHETRIYVNEADGGYVNYGQPGAVDGDTVIGSMTSVGRFVGGQYKLGIDFFGFDPGEDVTVTVELLELATNLPEVTRDLLSDVESDPAINGIAFGLSDATIASIINERFTEPVFDIGPTPHLRMNAGIYYGYSGSPSLPTNLPRRPEVMIDVDAEEILVRGTIALNVYVPGSPFEFVAVTYAAVEVRCEPAMVTTTGDMLQLQVQSAQILPGRVEISIIDQGQILQGYPSVDAFRQDMENTLNSIANQSGPFAGLLPAYISSRPMPDYWNRAVNMELDFKQFAYRSVRTHHVDVGYLFAVFSVRSLMLPIPCYCEEEVALQLAADPPSFLEFDDPKTPPSQEPRPSRTRRLGALCLPQNKIQFVADDASKERSSEVWPPPAYAPILVAAELMAFGVSQRAFREIAKPYANQGDDKSYSTGGTVYASARFWYRSNLEDATIRSDGVGAVIDVTAEGSAKAAVRDRCGNDVASASVRLRIRINDTSANWGIRIEQEQRPPYTLTVVGLPSISLGQITIDFDHPGDPPPPLDQVDDWVLTTIANGFRGSLSRVAESHAKIQFIRTENFVNGELRLAYVDDFYFADLSLVLAARLEAHGG